jgi:hypothetical protein
MQMPDASRTPVENMADRELLEEIVNTLRAADDFFTDMMNNPMLAALVPQGDPVVAALKSRR